MLVIRQLIWSCLFFVCLFSVPVVQSAGNEISLASASLVFPNPIQEKYEADMPTPWGRAQAIEYVANDSHENIFYSFSHYRFSKPKTLDADLLLKAPQFFLINKKCIANTLEQTPLADANGRIWPQISFQGHCAASSSEYRVLVLIANNRLYQFHVGYRPSPKHPQLIQKGDLENAIKQLLNRFRVVDSSAPDNDECRNHRIREALYLI